MSIRRVRRAQVTRAHGTGEAARQPWSVVRGLSAAAAAELGARLGLPRHDGENLMAYKARLHQGAA